MKIGILALQGAVSEHAEMLKELNADPILVRDAGHLKRIDALIIPGGESTTISRLMEENGLFSEVKELAENGLPVWGTCAGAILLAKGAGEQEKKSGQKLLQVMDVEVDRNAFGRQKESFESGISFADFKKEFPAVFIRAPVIERVFGRTEVLASLAGKIIAAREKNLLATCFHPELSGDKRIHEFFLGMV